MLDKLDACEKAKAWRLRRRFTIKEIAEATGYSASTISDIEAGAARGPKAHPTPPGTMRRYRMCCAAIEYGLAGWDFTDSSAGPSATAHQKLVDAIKADC